MEFTYNLIINFCKPITVTHILTQEKKRQSVNKQRGYEADRNLRKRSRKQTKINIAGR